MRVLDELRDMLLSGWGNLPNFRGHEIRDGINTDLKVFEAAHPGLIDKTQLCENCGEPMPHYYGDGSGGPRINPGWSYVCTQVGEKYEEFYFGEDEEIWLVCPTCAQEAK